VNPAGRIAVHHAQDLAFERQPAGKLADATDSPQRICFLVEFKVAQVFQDDRRHGHAQRGGEILHRHRLLLL